MMSDWKTFKDTTSLLPPPQPQLLAQPTYSTVDKLQVLTLPPSLPSYTQLQDMYPLLPALVNRPKTYVTTIKTSLAVFEEEPYVVGHNRYYMLDGSSVPFALNKEMFTDFYITGEPALCFWSMEQEDVDEINSITFELAQRKQLYGFVKYINCCHYQGFPMDDKTDFYNGKGRLMSTPKANHKTGDFKKMKGKVWIKISGLVQHTCTENIKPIISIHQVILP